MFFLFKKTLLVCILLSLCIHPAAAYEYEGSPSGAATRPWPENNLLKVGVDPNLPPFQFKKGDRFAGFNIDIMKEIAKEQGLRIQFVPLSMEKSIDALHDNKIDMILGVPFTAEFSEKLDFTEPYLTSSVGVLVPVDSPIDNLTDLQGRRVAIQYNTLEYEFLKNIRDIHYHSIHQPGTGLELLNKGRAEAFVGNQTTIRYLLMEKGFEKRYQFIDSHFLPLEYSIAAQKGNYQLIHRFNIGIRHLKLSKAYGDIYNEWFESVESPLSEKLRKIKEVMAFVVVAAVVILLIGFRWNRQLQHEVNRKTKDLQKMNISLQEQVQKTKNSDQFKEQILESSIRGVVTCDKNGYISSINSVATDMIGETEKPVGKKASQFPLLQRMLESNMADAVKNGKKSIGKELELDLGESGIQVIRYDIQPLYDFGKESAGILVMFEDITAEKRLKDQLQEQEKSQALIQLVAGIAHEIRNPLTSIKTFVQLIPIKMNSEKFRSEISTLVPKEIDRLNELVEGLINYARPNSGEKKRLDLEKLLNSTIALFEQELENRNIRMVTDIQSGLWIEANESQMSQVLINLFLNAMESMEKKLDQQKGPLFLEVTAYQQEEEVIVKIRDEGEGMSPEETKKIFDPFYTSKTNGTGLGLSLSKQYIIENDGNLLLESEPGEGSIFMLKFPIKEHANHESLNHR